LSIYQGTFQDLPGHYQIYTAYQLQDGTLLETTEPLQFEVAIE